MKFISPYRILRSILSRLRTVKVLRYCWHRLGLYKLYRFSVFVRKFFHNERLDFYLNIIFFRRYFERRETTQAIAAAPPATQNLSAVFSMLPGYISIDFSKIKPIGGVSVKYYEPGAFRIQNLRSSKAKIGLSNSQTLWQPPAHVGKGECDEPGTDHLSICLAVSRRSNESLALQLFQIFICFLYLRSLQKQGYEVEFLLFDSARDKLSELYTTCLPSCSFPEDFTGVHRFQHLVFIERDRSWGNNIHWRQLLYTCGLSQDFHKFVLSAFGLTPPSPVQSVTRITLIRRKKHTTSGGKPCIDRVIKNEEEVIASLSERYRDIDFQAVYFEELPLAEQLNLFTQSDILVSMHGAGLIFGAYFTPPNAGLLELFPKYYRIPLAALTCRAIAAERGLHYKRWLNHRRANEFGSDVQPGVARRARYYRNPVRHSSLTRVPTAALIKRIDGLIEMIERAH